MVKKVPQRPGPRIPPLRSQSLSDSSKKSSNSSPGGTKPRYRRGRRRVAHRTTTSTRLSPGLWQAHLGAHTSGASANDPLQIPSFSDILAVGAWSGEAQRWGAGPLRKKPCLLLGRAGHPRRGPEPEPGPEPGPGGTQPQTGPTLADNPLSFVSGAVNNAALFL